MQSRKHLERAVGTSSLPLTERPSLFSQQFLDKKKWEAVDKKSDKMTQEGGYAAKNVMFLKQILLCTFFQ